MRQNHDQAQYMAAAILSVIKRVLNQQQKSALQKNSSKYQSSQGKGKKSADQQQLNYLKTESLYDELVNVLDKLKKIIKRMNTINKIKKPKLNIFNAKLMDFVKELENLIQSKGFNVKVDKYVVTLVEDTNKALTECDRILTSLEKDTGIMCCGKNDQTKYTFYRAIINISGFGHVWSTIPKFSPVVQEKIEKIQIYTPVKYDVDHLEKLIQKQIIKYWPVPEQREVVREIPCQRAHVDSQIIQSKQSAVSSLSESEHEIKNLNQQPQPNNYIKIEEVTKLKQDLEIEKQLREAHEKLFGFGKPQQTLEAIETYRKLAQKKNDKSSIACNALGQIYEQGKFTDADRQKSQQYYRRSASLNDSEGLYKIGKYLQKGLIKIPQDKSDIRKIRHDQLRAAVQYYEKAAEMNHLDAITDLGYIYQKGIQNSSSFLKISTVSKSHDDSNLSDNTEINEKYFINPNFNYALKYYTLAKKAQFPRAINNLGALLIRQHDSIEERVKGTNLQKGIKYLKKAAQMGYLKSYFNLGKCYQNGIGVDKNYESAKKYYQRGSQKGDLTCKVEFIKCFFTDGFPKNGQKNDTQLAKLIQLINQVLIQEPHNKQCLFYLGLFHQRGDGLIKNPQLAYNYVSKSANLGFLPAMTKLGDYYYSGFYVKKDLSSAVNLYEKAAKGGQPQAMINLSLILEKGLIKPTKGQSPDYIRYLQKQAMRTNSSNALLIAGLKQQNYKVNSKSNTKLNSKIIKSLELGNRDAINLFEKAKKDAYVQKQPKSNRNQLKQAANRLIQEGVKADKTITYQKGLKKIKSADNLKTARI